MHDDGDMKKRKTGMGIICAGTVLTVLAGCQKNGILPESKDGQESIDIRESTDVWESMSSQESTDVQISNHTHESPGVWESTDSQSPDQNDSDGRAALEVIVPKLPKEGFKLEDFVAEGWVLLDHVELDFNGDGFSDYVAVQQVEKDREIEEQNQGTHRIFPRILFAVAGDGEGKYHLDFQDENLIRCWSEGGVFGDPYLPLTAEGSSFSTHAFGGSGWKWSEDYTYTYSEGTWIQTLSVDSYGYGEYITSYREDNWETGVGVRKERSSEFDDMEKNWEKEEEAVWDIVYEISLDKPLTLAQSGKRSHLLTYRINDWGVSRVERMEGIEIPPDKIRYPGYYFLMEYRDEDGIFYSFPEAENGKNYLAFYRWEDNVLSILAEEEREIGQVEYYQGKVYYALEGTKLYRMNLDGTEKEILFDYDALEKNTQEYKALYYEISGSEIIIQMYLGHCPHPYFRMNIDGSGLHEIGQVPNTSA